MIGLIGLAVMFLGAAQALTELHWALWGAETVTISDQSLQMGILSLLPRFSTKFLTSSLSNLRVSSNLSFRRIWSSIMEDLALSSLGSRAWDAGTIAFDYGAKTYRFGKNLTDAEARQIVALIHERFPQYR